MPTGDSDALRASGEEDIKLTAVCKAGLQCGLGRVRSALALDHVVASRIGVIQVRTLRRDKGTLSHSFTHSMHA